MLASHWQVTSNEQMIRWLNNQITETQLHYSSVAVAGSSVLASRYSYRPPVPPAPGAAGGSGTTAPTLQGLGAGTSASIAGRPSVSTYRTPATAGLGSSGAGLASSAAGSTALPGSVGGNTPISSSGAAPRGPFRSSFYATHFGDRSAAPGGSAGGGTAGGASAAPAGTAAPRSLDLGSGPSPVSVEPTPAAAPAPGAPASMPAAATGTQAAPAAPSSGAASHLSSRLFEAPTFRMADTGAGRVAVPVTSGS